MKALKKAFLLWCLMCISIGLTMASAPSRLDAKQKAASPTPFPEKGLRQEDAPKEFKEQAIDQTKKISWLNTQGKKGERGTFISIQEGALSVDVESIDLLGLFEELCKRLDIEIVGKDAISGKVISVKFNDMNLEDGIRRLIRIAGIDNYAIEYRQGSESRYAVSRFFFLSGGARPLERFVLNQESGLEPGNGVDPEIVDDRKDQGLTEERNDQRARFISTIPNTNIPKSFLGAEIDYKNINITWGISATDPHQ